MKPLLILRPEPGASATAARAAALGIEVRRHPLFVAESVRWTLPDEPFDAMLLTSANAVRLAGDLPALPVHAVGEQTAAAARGAGLMVETVGTGGVGELLDQISDDLRLLHPSGEERTIPDRPRQAITSLTVYRMAERPLPGFELLEGTVVLVHSPAAGRRLQLVRADRSRVRVAAISPAAAGACGSGWACCEAASEPSDAALLSLAAKLCEERGQ